MTSVVVETRCRVCGRRLTRQRSVERGVGPVCERRLERIEALNRKLEECGEPREDQACQGFSCGHAPLGCADPRYCPHGETGGFDPEPLPTCPRCGKPSPNPRYCVSCGSPIRKAPEVAVA